MKSDTISITEYAGATDAGLPQFDEFKLTRTDAAKYLRALRNRGIAYIERKHGCPVMGHYYIEPYWATR